MKKQNDVSSEVGEHVKDFLAPDLLDVISYPIKNKIKNDARAAGIDADNPYRAFVALIMTFVSGLMFGGFANMLEGPKAGVIAGFIGGLFGYVLSYSGEAPGDFPLERKKKAYSAAARAMQRQVPPELHQQLQSGYEKTISEIENKHYDHALTLKQMYSIFFNSTTESIKEIDHKAYEVFMKAYKEEEKKLGI